MVPNEKTGGTQVPIDFRHWTLNRRAKIAASFPADVEPRAALPSCAQVRASSTSSPTANPPYQTAEFGRSRLGGMVWLRPKKVCRRAPRGVQPFEGLVTEPARQDDSSEIRSGEGWTDTPPVLGSELGSSPALIHTCASLPPALLHGNLTRQTLSSSPKPT